MRERTIYQFVWSMIKPYKWLYAIMMIAPLFTGLSIVGNYYSLKLLTDLFSAGHPVTNAELFWPIAIFVGAQIFIDVIWRASNIAEWHSEPFVRRAILLRALDQVQRYPYRFFQNTPSGAITSKIKGLLDGYDNFWSMVHHDFSTRVANTLILMGFLFIVSSKIAISVMLASVGFAAVMLILARKTDALSFEASNYRHAILGFVADSMSNVFTVLSFAGRGRERHTLEAKINSGLLPANIRLSKFTFLSQSIAAVLYWVLLVSLFLYLIFLRRNNQISGGDLVFVLTTTLHMSYELWFGVQKGQDFMRQMGDFKSAFALLKEHEPEDDSGLLDTLIVEAPSIEFDHIQFGYSADKMIFEDLSLAIQPGEKVGLVGLSGAGKSTLVSLLLKYSHPSKGSVRIGGQNIADYTSDAVRTQISLIPQDILLFHRTLEENIAYGKPDAHPEEIVASAMMANLHDLVREMPERYQTMVGERGVRLSGGQRQRVAIARAVLKSAPILILDEATSSLDAHTEQLIQESLDQLLERKSVTVIAIAHRLSTLKHLDRIVVLEKGRIAEQGTHDELLSKDTLYRKLWELQEI